MWTSEKINISSSISIVKKSVLRGGRYLGYESQSWQLSYSMKIVDLAIILDV